MTNTLLIVGLGGAVGAMGRYGVGVVAAGVFGRSFPMGTLLVNVLGALAIGFAYVYLVERSALSESWRVGLITGVLGGFTTFSAFSLESVGLLQENAYVRASLYIGLSVGLCLAATVFGLWLARRL